MDGSRADWRTFGEVDDTRQAGDGTGPAADGPSRGSGGGLPPAARGRGWAGGPSADDLTAGDGSASGSRLARLLPLAIAAASGAVAAAAVLVVLLGTGGAAAVVVDGGSPALPAGSGSAASEGVIPGAGDGAVTAGAATPGAGAGPGVAGSAATSIVVDVEGAVPRPGLVRLAAGARVGDAIAAAGGYAPTVDVARAAGEVNLAARVSDGDRVHVPAIGEASTSAPDAAAGGSSSSTASVAPGLVDVNRASATELDTLPGIGPVTAEKIIKARTTAPFRAVQELRDRKVVTAATYAKIAPLVTVGP